MCAVSSTAAPQMINRPGLSLPCLHLSRFAQPKKENCLLKALINSRFAKPKKRKLFVKSIDKLLRIYLGEQQACRAGGYAGRSCYCYYYSTASTEDG